MLHRRCRRSVGGKRRDRAHNQGERVRLRKRFIIGSFLLGSRQTGRSAFPSGPLNAAADASSGSSHR